MLEDPFLSMDQFSSMDQSWITHLRLMLIVATFSSTGKPISITPSQDMTSLRKERMDNKHSMIIPESSAHVNTD
jgi:hypothetical protein